ncbi:FAD-dependent oxidoreductase [Luteolibacter arcticus]|uniref:FAD-dependent oxidoreductase n=1 Tax=Luteolibacter arcticus TaxID=1581411 RepID=A0ABT3GKR3_9BACT|nr:FAD-dependent oxidoreductase [Luteolibacter arcticus]MCW1924080.1 FAD-dependent oxidoreductase [Luteolibacter arcticus]
MSRFSISLLLSPRRILVRLFVCAGLSVAFVSAHPEEFDVVVYGGTSGGITAAVASARMGKRVALVSPTAYLGGLTTSGLGWTDLKNAAILGGLSKEFYHRVYLHYAAQPNWNSVKSMAGQHMAGFDHTKQLGIIFEPKVATQIYDEMLAETTVQIFTGLLDLTDGVAMNGQRITSIKLEDGRVFTGKMFIDASYEGDVMAGAGVSFYVGREANSVYGETINGVQNPATNDVVAGLDPYNVKGNPASGLLPGIKASIAANGTADGNLQAYCYRMCLTNNPANRVMVAQPANYADEDFELVLRAVEAGQTQFMKMDGMPNAKTDSNNLSGVSLDYIGKNWGPGWDWSTLNHQERAALAAEHIYWQLGLLWTIQNHPRVLAKVGANGLYPGWGLAADEFTDTGNFPPQLYVREARRMVSDYVMTTKNCAGSVVAPDSVGMGAYAMDSHHTQRFNSNGSVKNEGGVYEIPPAPYPISYRSLVPKVGQCENLLVPWCLSTSHMAFGSARMEPVFMTMGQSAATAAALAINDGTTVQQVPYEKLAAVLRADGQVLSLQPEAYGIIVDSEDATGAVITGNWTASSSVPGFNGTSYLHDGGEGRGQKSVRFTPVIPTAGSYRVSLRWNANSNRATNVPIAITHGGGVTNTTVNQQANGSTWFDLGVFSFTPGGGGNLLLSNTGVNGHVIADAAMWTRIGQLPTVRIYSPVPGAIRGGSVPATLVFTREGDAAAPLQVFYQLSGSAQGSAFTPQPTGSVTIPAGKREFKLPLAALSSTLPMGEKALVLQLSAHASYSLGGNNSATILVRDTPFDSWRFARFNSAELADPSISGPLADPDGSGAVNLLRFFSGTESWPRTSLLAQGNILYFEFDRHRAAAGLGYDIEESDDLQEWNPSPRLTMHAPTQDQGEVQKIQIPVRSSGPPAEGRKFFRLNVAP